MFVCPNWLIFIDDNGLLVIVLDRNSNRYANASGVLFLLFFRQSTINDFCWLHMLKTCGRKYLNEIKQGYKQERETLMEQEKEAKRNEMLFRLRAQAKHEDDVSIRQAVFSSLA